MSERSAPLTAASPPERPARPDPHAALSQLHAAAGAGDVDAQFVLGQAYQEGTGIACDPHEGLHWYRLAASAGHAMAMNMVGRCHELGRGTAVDLELAAAWYRRAADRGRALALYRLAAAQGHAKSMNLIGRHYDEGWEVERDPVAAEVWYRRSAEGGDFRGQCSYASVLVQAGRVDEALEWLRRAARTATPAFLHQLRISLADSPVPALRELAAELGHSPDAGGC